MKVNPVVIRWGVLALVVALPLTLGITAPARAQDRITLEDLPLAAMHSDNAIAIYDAGSEPVLLGGAWDYVSDLVWSPDGETLAFTSYGWDQVLLVSSPAGSPATVLVPDLRASGMPISFANDGRVLYAQQTDEVIQTDDLYGPVFELHAVAPQDATQDEVIGTFIFAPGCGGGSGYPADWRYWDEAGFQGNATILALTEYGIVHNGNCIGQGVALADIVTGEDVMLDADIYRAKVSPDGTQVLGIRGDGMALIDLATRAVTSLPTIMPPDQVAWGAPGSGTVFYSVRQPAGENLVFMDEEETFATALGLASDFGSPPLWRTFLYRTDLATGTEEELTVGGYYAVGRMIATPDGERLLFSMVPNMFEWASAILDGTLDPTTEEGRQAGRDMVQTMFFSMDLDTADFYFLGEDVNQASLNTALYGN